MTERIALAISVPAVLLLAQCAPSQAKPIAFADGTTVMAEWGGTTMREAQIFYAPRYDVSVGGGYEQLISDLNGTTTNIVYGRVNYLAKRWNLEDAQANIFVWGGLGGAHSTHQSGDVLTGNGGAQFDYETRRIYFSAKTDLQHSSEFSYRIDTAQFGVALYPHEFNTLATWVVVQARNYTGGLYNGIESALLLRLFKGNRWIEAGVTNGGHLQAMFMIDF
jgi:hypothetical protein